MKLITMFMVLLLTTSAGAEFTIQEKAEVLKFVESGQNVRIAMRRLGDAIYFDNVSLVAASAAQYEVGTCGEVLGYIMTAWGGFRFANGVPVTSMVVWNDPAFVADNMTRLTGVLSECTRAHDALVALADQSASNGNVLAALAQIDQATARLDTFDRSLPYLDGRPPAYPANRGPHGFYAHALFNLDELNEYLFQTVRGTGQAGQVGAPFSRFWVRELLIGMGDAAGRMYRIIGLDQRVILPSDQATIDQMAANSGGLRPPDFWELVLALRLSGNESMSTDKDGVSIERGMGNAFFQGGTALSELLRVTASSAQQFALLVEANRDFIDAWRRIDGYMDNGGFEFAFNPVAPPGGQCPEICPEGESCQPPPELCPSVECVLQLTAVNAGVCVAEQN